MEAKGVVERRRNSDNGPVGTRNCPVVSVVIVNFNGGSLLCEAVRSVLSSTVLIDVFVSDNGSTDGSILSLRRLFGADPRLQIIDNAQNLGFARAANVAIRKAAADFVLLLNPDCIVRPDTLSRMLQAMQTNPQAGIAGCLIRDPDGGEQAGCRRAVPTPWRTLVRVLHLDKFFPSHPRFRNFILTREPLPEIPVYLEAISGAFMLVRRAVMEQVGLLDEGYFMHCEDLDWCMRFRQAGWGVLFVPDVEVFHYKGACSHGRPIRVLWYKHRGMVRFYLKFFHSQYTWPLMPLVIIAVWSRFLLLAGLALIDKLRLRHTRDHVEPVVTPEVVGQPKIMKADSVDLQAPEVVNDPMLVMSAQEAKRPNSRLH